MGADPASVIARAPGSGLIPDQKTQKTAVILPFFISAMFWLQSCRAMGGSSIELLNPVDALEIHFLVQGTRRVKLQDTHTLVLFGVHARDPGVLILTIGDIAVDITHRRTYLGDFLLYVFRHRRVAIGKTLGIGARLHQLVFETVLTTSQQRDVGVQLFGLALAGTLYVFRFFVQTQQFDVFLLLLIDLLLTGRTKPVLPPVLK